MGTLPVGYKERKGQKGGVVTGYQRRVRTTPRPHEGAGHRLPGVPRQGWWQQGASGARLPRLSSYRLGGLSALPDAALGTLDPPVGEKGDAF